MFASKALVIFNYIPVAMFDGIRSLTRAAHGAEASAAELPSGFPWIARTQPRAKPPRRQMTFDTPAVSRDHHVVGCWTGPCGGRSMASGGPDLPAPEWCRKSRGSDSNKFLHFSLIRSISSNGCLNSIIGKMLFSF